MHLGRGLIFDFDGTIAETEQDGHRIAYNEAFTALGLDWHWDRSLYTELLFVAGGKERVRYYAQNYEPGLPAGAPPDLIDRVHAEKVRRFAIIGERMPLRPGVRRLVKEAKAAGFALAIATTASLAGVRSVLSQYRSCWPLSTYSPPERSRDGKNPRPTSIYGHWTGWGWARRIASPSKTRRSASAQASRRKSRRS